MKRFVFTILFTIIALGSVNAQLRKMSPFVRQAAMEGRTMPAFVKGAKGKNDSKRLIAFVRTTDKDVVTEQGCDVLLELGDIIIASIPLQNIEALAAMPEVQSIEASPSNMQSYNDQASVITNASKLWETPTQTLKGYTGKDVVVGVVDSGIDFLHPTFRTADGQHLRIKAVWDWLDFTNNGSEVSLSPYIGRQYVGEEQIMQKKHSADSYIVGMRGHGTHTSATAAGSGYNGSTVSQYIGMAPEADLCIASVDEVSNRSLIPEDRGFLYTRAADILAYKYIFDYAESVGKPCVINVSMGEPEDLYQNETMNEAFSRIVGPGRIICAAAGNDADRKTYIHKPAGKEKAGAFLSFNGTYNTWLMSSTDYPMINLTFYPQGEDKVEWHFDTNALRETPDESHNDTLVIDNKRVRLEMMAYPSWVDNNRYAIDIVIDNMDESPLGTSMPVALTLTDAGMDIEAFSQRGHFTSNSQDPSLADCDNTHNIGMPGALDDVICVGSVSYRANFINYEGNKFAWYSDSGGKRSVYSSIGPNKKGNLKPEVVAPGQNVISALNSYYNEVLDPEDDFYRKVIVETFDSDGRTYGWAAMSGTSQAAPVVTGIVALWLQENPNLTPDNIREIIANTSRQEISEYEYPNMEYGYGLIDAQAGMGYIKKNFPTSIGAITTPSTSAPVAYYDINGCRLNGINGKRGIFIVTKNGKTYKVQQ